MARPRINHELLGNCLKISQTTSESAKAVLKIYANERGNKKGPPTDQEQDLLRAALLLVCAGLDSFLKQLVDDCVEEVRKNDKKSRQFFTARTADLLKLKETKEINHQIIASALLSGDPEQYFVSRVKETISEHSLQNYGELQNVLKAFGFDENIFKDSKEEIKNMFTARNDIAHDYDYDFSVNRSAGVKHRIQRTKEEVQEYIRLIEKIILELYTLTNQKLLESAQ